MADTMRANVELNLVEAVNLALARALQEDESVIVLGEDVGIDGGVFRATEHLLERFDSDRVRDTPLSEAMIGGLPIGLAAMGFRPVAEIQFMGFIYPVIDQLVNHASRMRTRTRGRLTCPLVVRAPYGGGVHAPEHHSESMESDVRAHPRHSRRDSIFTEQSLRIAVGGYSRSGSGRVSRAQANLSRDA